VVPYYEGRKDANELYLDKGPKALARCIQEARPYRPDSIINGKDLFKRIKEAKDTSGTDILYPELSGMLHGIGPRRIYLFTAGAGIGKSTIVHEIGHDIVEKTGDKLGVLALEEDPGEAALRHMSIASDKPLHLLNLPDKELEEIHEKVFADGRYEFYDHFGSQDIDAILSKIRFMAVSLDCKWIILDHISIVVSGQESIHEADWKRLDRLMTNLRSLVDETKIGVLAVAHLKRPDNKGKSYNEGRKVALTDLRGSAALEQLSDIVIAAERDQQGKEPNKLTLRMLKNRKAGKTGPADTLEYNPMTGRLLATEGGNSGVSGPSKSSSSLPTDF
jgi:twinkle protein